MDTESSYIAQTYEGRPHFQCSSCPFDSFDETRMRSHVRELHRETANLPVGDPPPPPPPEEDELQPRELGPGEQLEAGKVPEGMTATPVAAEDLGDGIDAQDLAAGQDDDEDQTSKKASRRGRSSR